MKVLLLSSRVPHEGVKSGHIIVCQRLNGLLARGHQVGLATFARKEDERFLDSWRKKLVDLVWTPDPRESDAPCCRIMRWKRPAAYRPMLDKGFFKIVGDLVERSRYDVVVAEYSFMGQYLYRNPFLPAVRRVVSVHHNYTLAYEKIKQHHPGSPSGLKARMELLRLRPYEQRFLGSMDRVLVLTMQELYGMRYRQPDLKVKVVPCGVDTERFHPMNRRDGPPQLLYTGDFSDGPHHEGACWFLKHIWPQLVEQRPGLSLLVVGPNVSRRMKDLARRKPGVSMPGGVDDVRPYLERATVFVCPLHVGSGLRVKLLEAMAAGLPVVGTTPSFEGLPARIGENCFIGDTPEMMRRHIEILLEDDELRFRMAAEARLMVEERFSLERTLDAYEQELLSTIQKG